VSETALRIVNRYEGPEDDARLEQIGHGAAGRITAITDTPDRVREPHRP
jgi:hypothetical protein